MNPVDHALLSVAGGIVAWLAIVFIGGWLVCAAAYVLFGWEPPHRGDYH